MLFTFSVGISLVAITAAGNTIEGITSNKENNTQNIHLHNTTSSHNSATSTQNGISRMEHFNKNASQAIEVLKASNIVCFDVDSTVIKEEGIDELAKFCGKGAEVQEL